MAITNNSAVVRLGGMTAKKETGTWKRPRKKFQRHFGSSQKRVRLLTTKS
jgi:hypothetical protein